MPRPAALVRDFVNTLDHELGTDELATPAGLTGFLMSQDLLDAGRADEEQLARAVALRVRPARRPRAQPRRRAGVRSWPSTTCCRTCRSGSAGRPTAWSPHRPRTASPGALARVGLAALEARASEVWWRLKICAFDECEWAYYDHSKNRSRHYCEYGCGNKLKTRAYRARRRAGSTDTSTK